MLMNSPGSVGFELAPFKMPQEYLDILGGIGSEKFEDFRELVKLGFLALRKRSETLLSIVEIMERGDFLTILILFRFETTLLHGNKQAYHITRFKRCERWNSCNSSFTR